MRGALCMRAHELREERCLLVSRCSGFQSDRSGWLSILLEMLIARNSMRGCWLSARANASRPASEMPLSGTMTIRGPLMSAACTVHPTASAPGVSMTFRIAIATMRGHHSGSSTSGYAESGLLSMCYYQHHHHQALSASQP